MRKKELTLGNCKKYAIKWFGENHQAVEYVESKIKESPNGEKTPVYLSLDTVKYLLNHVDDLEEVLS